jgi:outer membrane receptor protein involved in Fe transport
MQINNLRRVGFQSLAYLLMALLLFAAAAYAQTETGQITGTVFDPAGAVVPNAEITARNIANGSTRTTTSTSAGIYVVANLEPGDYDLTVAATGFETQKRRIQVAVGAKVGVDPHLVVGNTSTVVEVAANAVQVNTESQTLGSTINTQSIMELPSVNRDPYALVATTPNISPTDPDGRGVGYAINGMRSASTNVMLDGVANNNEFGAGIGQAVPMDSVQEYSVLTSNYTAEVGRASGGVVNLVTKSGTNEFHGTAYEFNRVSALASNGFYNNANSLPKSIFDRNNFGYSVGGPIKRSKLFFFQNTEWLRIRSYATATNLVPTPQFIGLMAPASQAFFSAYGKLRPDASILNTYTKDQLTAAGSNPCSGGATGGPCASLPGSTPMFNQVTYRLPSAAGAGTPQNEYLVVGNLDYTKSEKTQLSLKYALQNENFFNGTNAYSPYAGYDTGETDVNNHITASMTHSFSSTFISQTRLSFNRLNDQQPLGTAPVGPTLYMASSVQTLLGYNITFPGYLPWSPGSAIPFGGPQNFAVIAQDISKVVGKHNFRFGGQYEYMRDNRMFGAYEEAVETLGTNKGKAFDNLINGLLYSFNAAINPQGKFPGGTVTLPVGPPDFTRSNRYNEGALYGQDTWKVAKNITLSLGLRYEYYGTQHNKNGQLDSNYYLGSGSTIQQQIASGSVQVAANSPEGALWVPGSKNFAPRIGVAWDISGDGKTSLRAGWGIGYERNFGNVTFNVIQNPPAYAVLGLTAGVDLPTIPIAVSNVGPLAGSTGSKVLPAVTLRAVDPNIKQAYAHQFSAALEHQFTASVLGSVSYSGSAGEDLYAINSYNKISAGNMYLGIPCTPGSSPGSFGNCTARLNPQYGNINWRGNGGISNYNALIGRVVLRDVAHSGVTLDANYTWSHAIDNLSSTFSAGAAGNYELGFMDPYNPMLDRGNADFDVRHRMVVSGTWNIPVFKGNTTADKILGGWEFAPIFNAHTGGPVTLYDCSNDYTYCTRAQALAPLADIGVTNITTSTPDLYNYYPLSASKFAIGTWANPKTQLSDFGPFPGNMLARNSLYTPGAWNLDLGLYKNNKLTERMALQLRLELYNAFNHANFTVNGSTLDVSSYSNVQGSYNGNRNIQLGAKLTF